MTLRRNSMVYHLRKAWISMILLTSFAVFLCIFLGYLFAVIWVPFWHPSTTIVHIFRWPILGRFLGQYSSGFLTVLRGRSGVQIGQYTHLKGRNPPTGGVTRAGSLSIAAGARFGSLFDWFSVSPGSNFPCFLSTCLKIFGNKSPFAVAACRCPTISVLPKTYHS